MKACLPKIPLAAHEMVALIDSGCTLNAAWIEAHFPQYRDYIIQSKAQALGETATTAGGHELHNEGRCRIETSIDGDNFPVAFQNMRVGVPILSVRKYVRSGWDFKLSDQEGGSMTCRQNGKTFQFIECDDAFWAKFKIGKPPSMDAESSTVSARPGNP